MDSDRTDVRTTDTADVWIVEDNALFRETLVELIDAQSGLRCAGAFGDAESALHALTETGRPTTVLMDIELPGMDGTNAVRRILAVQPDLPVIMLTVHQSSDRIFQAVCAGASGYLLKSASSDEIIAAIGRVLEGGAAMDARIARRVLEMFARFAAPRTEYGLSDRETEILRLLVDGFTKHQIAQRLFLSPHTVDQHVRHIYGKLHVHNRSSAVSKAVRENLLPRS